MLPLARCIAVCPDSRRGIVTASFSRRVFWGQELEAPPYPSAMTSSLFGTVSQENSLTSTCVPFTVELFAAEDLLRTPRSIRPRSSASPHVELPASAEVERTFKGPDPLDGICTRFNFHGLETSRGMSTSPRSTAAGTLSLDRTSGLVFWLSTPEGLVR